MKRFLQILGFAAASVTFAAASAELFVNEQNVGTFYRDFTRLTKRPHLVSPLTSTLCTTPSRAMEEQEGKKTGPHYKARVHIYANPVALPAIAERMTQFPVGAIVVKEKLGDGDKVAGIGGMIKRAAGYDPPNGDWEYFYYEGTDSLTTGRISSCIECHRSARSTDYVYSVWSLGE